MKIDKLDLIDLVFIDLRLVLYYRTLLLLHNLNNKKVQFLDLDIVFL